MKLGCPACGAVYSLDVLLTHDSAREAVMAALALPAPLGKLLVQYIALFRPAQKQLTFDRLARLLGELQPLIADAKIEHGGRIWPAPQSTWLVALQDLLAKRDAGTLRLPLASHGLLLAIIAGLADKAASTAERKREAELRGATPIGGMPAETQKPVPNTPSSARAAAPTVRSEIPQSFKDTAAKLGLAKPKGEKDGQAAVDEQ